MKIYGFKARLHHVEYMSGKGRGDEDIYYIRGSVEEITRGRKYKKTYHNVTLYLTKEQFDAKDFRKGDIIEISDSAKLSQKMFQLNSYKTSFVKNRPVSALKTDDKGRTYAESSVYTYTVSCKIGEWSLYKHFTDIFYWQFGRLKVPMDGGETPAECEAEFRNQIKYEFYLNNEEYKKVEGLVGNYFIHGYKDRQSVAKQAFNIQMTYLEDIERWKVTMTKLEVPETESVSEAPENDA